MSKGADLFNKIADRMSNEIQHVERGPMMAAPGLKYKGKVFAFFYEEEMTFKLGKDFDPVANDISFYSYLSPFKNKPPMKAWFQIPESLSHRWQELADLALDKMRG